MWDSVDRLDPRVGLGGDLRRRLAGMSATVARAMDRAAMAALGLDEDGIWRTETGRDEDGWTRAERERWALWKATGGSVPDAAEAWRRETRREFVRRLIAEGRLGRGDEVMAR